MFDYFQKIPQMYQGIISIAGGLILLLHTLGIIKVGLDLILIVAALYMIVCGVIKSGLYNQILLLLKRYRPPKGE